MDDEIEDGYGPYPEEPPAPGVNHYDIIRILTLPLVGWSQGTASMFDQFHGYLIMQSRIHDERVEAERLNKALR